MMLTCRSNCVRPSRTQCVLHTNAVERVRINYARASGIGTSDTVVARQLLRLFILRAMLQLQVLFLNLNLALAVLVRLLSQELKASGCLLRVLPQTLHLRLQTLHQRQVK